MSAIPAMPRRWFGAVRLAVLGATGAATLLPLLWMVAASVMPAGDVAADPLRLVPRRVTVANYAELFTRLALARAFANSVVVAAAVTGLSLVVNAMAGYAFAKLRFRGRETLFRVLLGAMVIPAQVGMLPLFLLLKQLGLINTYGGVIVPGLASIFGIFLVRQYALAIPDALLDAARVDGASEWRIFRSIVVPACRPILVTLAVLTFLGAWNDFLWPLIVLTDETLYTLPVALANLSGEYVQDIELMMAGAVLTIVPVVTLFVALQRHYIRGILSGGLRE
jgi:multiple sugar transport system permease protein